jgi:hypothetical protein
MSRQLALDTINLKPVDRWAHTEYSLNYHTAYLRKLLGRSFEDVPPSGPEYDALVRDLHAAWHIDFMWSVSHGLHGDWGQRGRATDMGHAAYAADGSDQRAIRECPFKDIEAVWAFDAVAEYGLPDFDEQVAAYEQMHRRALEAYPDQLQTGGYYRTLVSGAIDAFGWDMFLMALSDPVKMEPVLDSFFRYTQFHMNAWAQTGVEVCIQHDDFVWSEGAFMHPDIYRKVIIPRYAELWKPLHAAGKKVLFCSDANFMEFATDVAEAGADGFIFEPMTDFGFMVERFGASHCLVGSYVDCRDMTFGRWDTVRADLDRTLELAERACAGLIVAVGNHLPSNVPEAMMERYCDYVVSHRRRA